jgi:hypothetical protein
MAFRKLFAAVLVLSVPLAGLAQTAPAAEPAKPAEAAPAAPAAKPAAPADTVKVTPYGFVLLNAFLDQGTFATKDYPGAVNRVDAGDAFLMSARQSRFGVRLALKDDNWTGAEFSGVIEFDFKAGQLAGATAASTNWYNGLMRLRLASATATWKFGDNSFAILAGQDYGLVNPLFAESLAWVADPLFWQAGNLWRRSPQIRATYDAKMGDFGFNLAAAVLSPADGYAGTTAGTPAVRTDPHGIDFGPGNASGQPDIEARAAVRAKMGDIGGTLGVGYHTEKRKYLNGTPVVTEDTITTNVVGVDLDLNLTKYLQVKGEYYTGTGTDDTYNGLGTSVFGAAGARDTVDVNGFWAQGILKPLPIVWITAGYGEGTADKDQVTSTSAREKNTQLAVGLIFNAGKAWRFGTEFMQVNTTYGDAQKFDATQINFNSMFRF